MCVIMYVRVPVYAYSSPQMKAPLWCYLTMKLTLHGLPQTDKQFNYVYYSINWISIPDRGRIFSLHQRITLWLPPILLSGGYWEFFSPRWKRGRVKVTWTLHLTTGFKANRKRTSIPPCIFITQYLNVHIDKFISCGAAINNQQPCHSVWRSNNLASGN
jgi:hypothetical protein